MTASERLALDTARVAARLREEEGVEVRTDDVRGTVWVGAGAVVVTVAVDSHRLTWVSDGGQAHWYRPEEACRHYGRGWPERLAEEALRILRGGDR